MLKNLINKTLGQQTDTSHSAALPPATSPSNLHATHPQRILQPGNHPAEAVSGSIRGAPACTSAGGSIKRTIIHVSHPLGAFPSRPGHRWKTMQTLGSFNREYKVPPRLSPTTRNYRFASKTANIC